MVTGCVYENSLDIIITKTFCQIFSVPVNRLFFQEKLHCLQRNVSLGLVRDEMPHELTAPLQLLAHC